MVPPSLSRSEPWRLQRAPAGGRKSDAISLNSRWVDLPASFVTHARRPRIGESPASTGYGDASSMIWFRSRIRSGARLALFALAFQMGVAFGHLHRDDLGLPPLPASAADHAHSAAAAPPANGNHQPASDDDYCPICASMALIATAMPALPPVLIVPTPLRHAWQGETPVRAVSTPLALSFRARAPPLA